MPIAHACFVLDRVRMAGPSYAGLGSGSGLVGEGSSELGSELQNCWVAFEHAGDGGCFFGEPSAASSSGSVSESSSYGMASAPRTGSEDDGASAIIRAISSLPVSFLMGVCQYSKSNLSKASGLNQGTLSPNQCYVKILSAFCSRATD